MDLIRIDNNKMKIMLTSVDMQSYALDTAEIDGDSKRTRMAFRHILNDVRAKTGFDALSDKLYVQLYPSRAGGCEMFVTKLGATCSLSAPGERPSPEAGRALPTPQTRTHRASVGGHERTVAFAFECLEHLLFACKRLYAFAFSGASAAYHDERGGYYLILSDRFATSLAPAAPLAVISEYGTQQNAETVRMYIREHGRPICEKNAVARLADL